MSESNSRLINVSGIWAIIGNVGYGKSALSVFLAYVFSLSGTKIYTNFSCDYSEKVDIEGYIKIKKSTNKQIAFIDEPLAFGLNARRSTQDLDIAMSIKTTQARHYNLEPVLISQLPSMIDKQPRELIKCYIVALPPTPNSFHYVALTKPRVYFHLSFDLCEKYVFGHYDTTEQISDELVFDQNTYDLFKEDNVDIFRSEQK